jgi:hypothetical protein
MSHADVIQKRYHRFGRWELVRLWLSYQRYAMLLFALALGLGFGGAYGSFEGYWYLGVPVALIGLKVGSFGAMVAARIPEKMRITGVAQRRIDAGRFEAGMVRDFCEDPCFRVMASEVLRRSGVDNAQRRKIVREFTASVKEEAGQTLIIDHTRGQVFKVEGDQHVLISNPTPTASKQGISS